MAKPPTIERIFTLVCCLSLIGVVLAGISLTACSSEGKADKLHKQALLLYKNHKYFNAIKKFEEALKIKPDSVPTLTMLADAYLQTGKPEIAIDYGTRATKLDPQDYAAFLTIGQAHLDLARADQPSTTTQAAEGASNAQQQIDAAAKIAQMLREKQPDFPEGLILQAKIDTINKQFEAAQRLYQKAVELAPDNTSAQLGLSDIMIIQQKYDEAEKYLRPLVQGVKNPNPIAVNQLALTLYRQKRYNEAYEVLKPWIIAPNPNPILSQYVLTGNILVEQIQTLKQIAKSNGDVSLDGAKGLDPMQQAQLKAAIDNLANLGGVMKGIFPTRPESFYFRAISYEMIGDGKEALNHYRKAFQRAPASVQYRMALALSLLGNKDYDEARQQFRSILRDEPGDLYARLYMAQSYASEGSYDEALSLLRDLYREKPGMTIIKAMLANVLVLTGEDENVKQGNELLAELNQSADQLPGASQMNQAQAAVTEGIALASKGQYQQADVCFKQAEDLYQQAGGLQPKNAIVQIKLADLANLRNDRLSAIAHIRRAVELDPQYLPMEARQFTMIGQYGSAMAVYEQLIKDNPENIEYKLAVADLMVLEGRPDDALKAYDTLLADHPDNTRAYLSKAELLARMDKRPEAIEMLKEQAGKFPGEIPLHLALARMLLQESRAPEAIAPLTNMAQTTEKRIAQLEEQKEPEAELTRMRKYLGAIVLTRMMAETFTADYSQIPKEAEQTASLDPSLASQARVFEAVALLHDGQAAQAVKLLDALKDQDGLPQSFPYLLSLVHLADGDKAGALAAVDGQNQLGGGSLDLYRQMIDNNPIEKLQAVAPDLLLEIFLTERPTYARVVLDLAGKTLQTLPDAPMLLARKAETLTLLGQADDALAIYDHMRTLMPDYSPVMISQAAIYKAKYDLDIRRGNTSQATSDSQKARSLLEEVLRQDPKSLPALLSLGDLAQKQDDLQTANDCYRKTIEIDPKSWTAYNNLAWNLSKSGQLNEAAEIGHKALEVVPDSGIVQDTVGWIEYQLGNLAEAKKLLTEASRRVPNNPEVRFHLAQVLAAQKETQAAVAELETLMMATPGYDQIGEVRALLAKLSPESPFLK